MSKFTTDYRARGICDRCGFGMRLRELRVLTIKTKNVDLRVCRRCWEKDHPQLRLGSVSVEDVQALRAPRPDFAGYPVSRETLVPVDGYLSGSERTFGLGQVGFVVVIAQISVAFSVSGVGAVGEMGEVTLFIGTQEIVYPAGVQADSSVGTVTVYTAYGLTSQSYPISYTEATDNTAAFNRGLVYNDTIESTDNTAAFVSGTLRDVLISYNNWPAEATDNSAAFISGTLLNVLVSYNNWPAEATDNAAAFVSGTLRDVLISYSNWPAEATDNSAAFISGTLV